MARIFDPFDDKGKHLLPLPDSTLRDLARNDSAGRDYRKLAVEILMARRSPLAKHPDLQGFVAELEVELDGIALEYPEPVPEPGPGPLTCGVTTKTLYGDSVVEAEKPEFTGFDEVQILNKPRKKPKPKEAPDAT